MKKTGDQPGKGTSDPTGITELLTVEAGIIIENDRFGILCNDSAGIFQANDILDEVTVALCRADAALQVSNNVLCPATGDLYDANDVLFRENDALCDPNSILSDA
jgi:hypothetical protein